MVSLSNSLSIFSAMKASATLRVSVLFLGKVLVFGQLLGDGTTSFGKREGSQIIEGSPGDSQRVYAWMGVKPFVLDADDRIQIDLGQLIHRCIVWNGLDLRSHFRHWLFCKRLPVKGVPIIDQHSGRDQCKQDCWQQDPFQNRIEARVSQRSPPFCLHHRPNGDRSPSIWLTIPKDNLTFLKGQEKISNVSREKSRKTRVPFPIVDSRRIW